MQRARKSIFPFLELPAELRNEIYVLVLGGRVIHGHVGRLCALPMDQNEAYLSSMLPPGPESSELFSGRHKFCTALVSEHLALNVLLTCRQVHTEAREVPFSDNIFAFRRPENLIGFLKRIGNARAARVRDILFYSANNLRFWSDAAHELAALPLHGLRIVRLYLEICPLDFDSTKGCSEPMNFETVDGSSDVFGGLQGLKAFKLTHVSVAIDRCIPRLVDKHLPSRSVLERWIDGNKQMILGHAIETDPRRANDQVAESKAVSRPEDG